VLNGGPILAGGLTEVANNATLAHSEEGNAQVHAVLIVDMLLIEENCKLKTNEELSLFL